MFIIARNILVHFPSSFSSIHLVSTDVMHPYSRINTTAAWKKLRFILSYKFDFHGIDNLSIAVDSLAGRILMSFSLDETLLPQYVNLSTSFREPPFSIGTSLFDYMYFNQKGDILPPTHTLYFNQVIRNSVQWYELFFYGLFPNYSVDNRISFVNLCGGTTHVYIKYVELKGCLYYDWPNE